MSDVDSGEKKQITGDADEHNGNNNNKENNDERKIDDIEKHDDSNHGGSSGSTNSSGSGTTKFVWDGKDIVEDEALYKSLQQMPFYHGFLPREDLRKLLKNDGDYLIRVSEVTAKKDNEKDGVTNIKRDLILSVYVGTLGTGQNQMEEKEPKSGQQFEGTLRNMVVRRCNGKFGIEQSNFFDSINELLQHYHQSNTGETKKNRILKTPIKLHSWEYRHSDIKLGQLLGEGAYGEVRTGVLTRKGREVAVAVKLMKGTADLNKIKIREMMKEARLMREFKHKNVVRFYGVAVDEQPLYILLELVKGGALNTYLQKNKKVSTLDLINMCLGAAMGLQYLHSNNCIHRDIAARNCLYSIDKCVKLSDFGLSRIGSAYKLCTSQKLPIKWLAAETITTLYFTFKTDVYSYGVMCFEIFSEGDEPWENITNTEAKRNVVTGKHLIIPDICPEKFRTFVYEKIYVKDPKRRVTMDDVVRYIEPIVNEISSAEEQRSDKGRRNVEKSELKSAMTNGASMVGIPNSNGSLNNNSMKQEKKFSTKKRGPKMFKTARRNSAHPGNHNMVEK